MTDEQIKQNAEAYAEQHAVRIDGGGYEEEYDYEEQENAYIAGAHSRDEEIKGLYNSLEHFRSIINNLRNPWISVEERLPKEDKDDKGYSVEVIGLFPDGRVSKCFCSIEEDIWFFEGLTCDKPTHWMPMPKLQTTK